MVLGLPEWRRRQTHGSQAARLGNPPVMPIMIDPLKLEVPGTMPPHPGTPDIAPGPSDPVPPSPTPEPGPITPPSPDPVPPTPAPDPSPDGPQI